MFAKRLQLELAGTNIQKPKQWRNVSPFLFVEFLFISHNPGSLQCLWYKYEEIILKCLLAV
jgi:hypothetical protein